MPSLILVTGEFYAGQLISFTQKRDWLENTKKQLKKTSSSGAFRGGHSGIQGGKFSAGLLVRMKKIAFYTWRATREDGVLEYAHQVAHWQKSR